MSWNESVDMRHALPEILAITLKFSAVCGELKKSAWIMKMTFNWSPHFKLYSEEKS